MELLTSSKESQARKGQTEDNRQSASGTSLPLPAFQEAPETEHLLADFGPGSANDVELGPPPEFTPYEAEYFEKENGDVISHDSHLNSDGEALYRFLLVHAAKTPFYRLHCRGNHTETRHRWVTERTNDGRSQSRRETYTENVTDFDFYIDIRPVGNPEPRYWTVPDSQPAYRGLMVREVKVSAGVGTRKASRLENKIFKSWDKERTERGLPLWVNDLNGLHEATQDELESLQSSKTLRQWADEYCASPKYLKEFVFKKALYGWDIRQLQAATRSTIAASPYSGDVTVDFVELNSKVYIRPDNKLSRMLSNKWLKFLSILFLIFPFIWLFKRFHSRGGGRWEVCGGAYALKQWVRTNDTDEDVDPAPAYDSEALPPISWAHPLPRVIRMTDGARKLVGLREGEWFKKWEWTIKRMVRGHYQSTTPLPEQGQTLASVGELDGYLDT